MNHLYPAEFGFLFEEESDFVPWFWRDDHRPRTRCGVRQAA